MQMLFQGDLGKQTPDEDASSSGSLVTTWDAETRGLPKTVRVAEASQAEIDALIEEHAQNGVSSGWRSSTATCCVRRWRRCSATEHSQPRSSSTKIPGVAPHAAAPESVQFLNGVLDAIARLSLIAALAMNRSDGYAAGMCPAPSGPLG